jgi:hypothetical protein
VSPRLLPPAAARTLYNAADALRPPAPGEVAFDWVAGVEAELARRGPPSARRLRAILRRLEWDARLRKRAPFWRLSRTERAALLAAFGRRRPMDHALLRDLLQAGREGARAHSSGE